MSRNETIAVTPDDCRIYAIGDIHGRADLLVKLLDKIVLHTQSRPEASNQVLIFLGDYINRGRQAKEVIDILTSALPQNFETIFLKGNHEVLLERFLDDPAKQLGVWLTYGGSDTMTSYGVNAEEVELGEDFNMHCRDLLLEAMPPRHRAFFRNLKLCVTMGDYFFVHAGVRPGVPLEDQIEDDLLWISKEFLEHDELFDKVIVHGHIPRKEPQIRDNRISIDTRAWFTGCLTAIMLEGIERELLTTRSA